MALTKKERLALLRTSTQERVKNHAGSGENFTYLDQEKLKELGLGVVRPKAREENYYFNVLPYIDKNDKSSYVLVAKTHSIEVNGYNRNVICPKAMFGLPCPVCEKRMDKMANDPDDSKAIDKLKVKERELYYIEDVSNKTEKAKGIQLFEVAATFFGWKIKPLVKPKIGGEGVKGNKGYIDISDFENGRIVSFSVGKKTIDIGGKPVQIPDYTGHSLEERENPISEAIQEKVVELPSLEDLIIVHTYEELYELLNNEPKTGSQQDEEPSPKAEKEDKKSDLKKKVEKIQKAKQKSIDLDFDYMNADADELEDYILENDIEIDGSLIGNEKKMKIVIKRFIKAKKEEAEAKKENKTWPSVDDIDDIDEFMDDNEEELKDFCDFHGIEYDDDDVMELRDAIEDWFIS